jgi:hypothetical protein
MNPNYLISVKRTVAQVAAAWVVAQAARLGIELPGSAVSDLLFAGLFALYYVIYRAVEQRFPDALALFGSALQPMYENVHAMDDLGENDADR